MAQQTVRLREVVTSNFPDVMLNASPKGTVPVLVCGNGTVIDESLDIMIWALENNDPHDLLLRRQPHSIQAAMMTLARDNDSDFVPQLDRYKIAARYHHDNEIDYRNLCEQFIAKLERRLYEHEYLILDRPSLADYAVLPFIRQFSRVDRKWYLNAPYPNLQRWLTTHYQNPLYSTAMTQYPLWDKNTDERLFPPQ